MGPARWAADPTRMANLRVIQQKLKDEPPDYTKMLQQEQGDLLTLKRQLVEEIKRNYVLEGQLTDIDNKIGLFVHNRISIQEVIAQSHGVVKNSGSSIQKAVLSDEQRMLYQDLFYLLQTQPRYLGTLPKVLKMDQIQPFIQTIAFTVFGDQYSEREEYLLLSVFQVALQEEFDASKSIGSLLRGNSAVTKMIREYTKREQGKLYLENVLAANLEAFVRIEGLNLEINPLKVQQMLINQEESETGVKSTIEKAATEAEAAQDERVVEVIRPRIDELNANSEAMLQGIFDSLDQIPYGIRWIAKQIALMTKEKFPECSRYDVATMVGGFVYLRYINPAIVTPDADSYKLVTKSLNQISRRNLVLVAKTLQNLSNFVQFGDKEQYMMPMNDFIEAHKEPLARFCEELINVLEPDEHLMVDRNFVDVGMHQDPVIKIQLNELFFLHNLLVTHIDIVAPDGDDPLRIILEELGTVPAKVDKDKNVEVSLTLSSRSKGIGAEVEDETSEAQQLYSEVKSLLMSILSSIDLHTLPFAVQHTLEDVLEAAERYGDQKDASVLDTVAEVKARLEPLSEAGFLQTDSSNIRILQDIEEDMGSRARLNEYLRKENTNIQRTLERVRKQHSYLLEQLQSYQEYLENVKQKQTGNSAAKPAKESSSKLPKTMKPEKIAHNKLVSDGIILESRVPEARRRKTVMAFTVDGSGQIDVTAICHGFPVDSYQFDLDDLLERQYHNQTTLELEYVTLDLNLFIHLINSMFAKTK